MNFIFRACVTLLLTIAGILLITYFSWYKPKFNSGTEKPAVGEANDVSNRRIMQRLILHSAELKQYIKTRQFNQAYCFIADMKIASGKKRFFVYNVLKDSVELAGLVTHGSGKKSRSGKVVFSNAANSLCTSLGKYKIGNSYYGKFGLAFKLHGLDQTNSNAYIRFVVLHAHSCVPDEATAPLPICESWGCPTVSPLFLAKLEQYIRTSNKPVLLSIYE